MSRHMNQESRSWLARMADIEDGVGSVSVGGLACDLGVLSTQADDESSAFGAFIEFARKKKGLSQAELAKSADVDEEVIQRIEHNEETAPSLRTVFQLAQVLEFPESALTEVAGLTQPRPQVAQAALRFAARSRSVSQLTEEQKGAFEELVKVIADVSGGKGA